MMQIIINCPLDHQLSLSAIQGAQIKASIYSQSLIYIPFSAIAKVCVRICVTFTLPLNFKRENFLTFRPALADIILSSYQIIRPY